MTTTNPRRQCERLWAANKYLVLSHSNKIYLEIRNYLKNDEVSLDQAKAYINKSLDFPENPGQVVNSFQHICSYFKKSATASEKEMFMVQMDSYKVVRETRILGANLVQSLLFGLIHALMFIQLIGALKAMATFYLLTH